MTGHGHGESAHNGIKVSVEMAAVNRKQLEVQVNLPRDWDRFESAVRERVQKKVSRGRVSVRVTIASAQGEELGRVVVNEALARECVAALRQVAEAVDVEGPGTIESVMRVPGVIRVESGVEDPEALGPAIRRATDQAVKGLVAMRSTEGKQLGADLEHRIGLMIKALARIEKAAPKVLERYREGLMERLSQAGVEGLAVDDDRVLKEVVLFSDRSDITEEITRLRSHFQQFDQLVGSSKPVGRTLDFLAQEMNREINTIGSKANDAGISREVVTLKTELEKFREQVQNLE